MAFMPAVILTAGIAVISLWENPQVPRELATSDKLMHGLMYTFLAIAWMAAIAKSQIINLKSQIKYSVIVCLSITVFGALLELLQHYCTVTRSGEMMDILADFIGALIGVLLIALWKIRSTK